MNALRYSLRQLGRQPGFTAVAVLTLALGIGANITLLGLVDYLFFRPLPARDPDRLVMLLQKSATWKFPHGHSWPDFLDYREQVPEFDDASACFMTPAHVSMPGKAADRTWIECVSANYFTLLDRPPLHGRYFARDPGTSLAGTDARVVVLGHDYWRRQFGADPTLIGDSVHLNGKPFTVIGIMPADFCGAQWAFNISAWVPAAAMPQLFEGGQGLLESRGSPAFRVMARLKPGARLDQARASVDVVASRLAAQFPDDHRQATALVMPEARCRPEPTFSEIVPYAVFAFLGIVVLVLLIACANVANLMFARALARQREMGIRSAIGASRARLIRQLLLESVVLALVAGAVGMGASHGFELLLRGLSEAGDIPIRAGSSWSWRILGATVAVSVLTGLVTGIAPALRATRLDLQSVLKDGGGTLVSGGRHSFRTVLVVSQIACCLAVLVAGALFLDTLRKVAHVDLGFRPAQVVNASLDLGLQGYDSARGRPFLRELLTRGMGLPGVANAAVARAVPFDYGAMLRDVAAEGTVAAAARSGAEGYITAAWNVVSESYLRTLGIVLVAGRDFVGTDREGAPRVALINQTLAKRLWPDADPLGRRFHLGRDGDLVEVIGVVRDGKYIMVGEEPRPFFYLPIEQHYISPITLHVRTRGEPSQILPSLRALLREMDPDLPLYNAVTMDQHLRQSAMALMPLRAAAKLAAVQGALGLFLSAMGVYGVVAYLARQRTREIGLRLALGAQPADIARLVLREGWRLTAWGLGLGLVLALTSALLLSRLLYGLSAFNPPVFLAVLVILGGVALLASYVPARRATRIDPLLALRTD